MPAFLLEKILDPDVIHQVQYGGGFLPDSIHHIVATVSSQLWIYDLKNYSSASSSSSSASLPLELEKVATIEVGAPILTAVVCLGFIVVVTEDFEIYAVSCAEKIHRNTSSAPTSPAKTREAGCKGAAEEDEKEEDDEGDDSAQRRMSFKSTFCCRIHERSPSSTTTPHTTPRVAQHQSGQWIALHVVPGWIHFLFFGEKANSGIPQFTVKPSRLDRYLLHDLCFLHTLQSTCIVPLYEYDIESSSTASEAVRKVLVNGYSLAGRDSVARLTDVVLKVPATSKAKKVIPLPDRELVVVESDSVTHCFNANSSKNSNAAAANNTTAAAKDSSRSQYQQQQRTEIPLSFIAVDALLLGNGTQLLLLSDAGDVHRLQISSAGDNVDDVEDLCKCIYRAAKHPEHELFQALYSVIQFSPFVAIGAEGDAYLLNAETGEVHVLHQSRGPITCCTSTSSATTTSASNSVVKSFVGNNKGYLSSLQSNFHLEVMAEVEGGGMAGGGGVLEHFVLALESAKHYILWSFVSSTRIMEFGEEGLIEADETSPCGMETNCRTVWASYFPEEGNRIVQVLASGAILAIDAATNQLVSKTNPVAVGGEEKHVVSLAAGSAQCIALCVGRTCSLVSIGAVGGAPLWSTEFAGSDIASVAINAASELLCVGLWEPAEIQCFEMRNGMGSCKSIVSIPCTSVVRSMAFYAPTSSAEGTEREKLAVGFMNGRVMFATSKAILGQRTAEREAAAEQAPEQLLKEGVHKVQFDGPVRVDTAVSFSTNDETDAENARGGQSALTFTGKQQLFLMDNVDDETGRRVFSSTALSGCARLFSGGDEVFVSTTGSSVQVSMASASTAVDVSCKLLDNTQRVLGLGCVGRNNTVVALMEPKSTVDPTTGQLQYTTIRSYDVDSLAETGRITLEKREVGMCMSSYQQEGCCIVSTALKPNDNSEPSFGRLLLINVDPLRTQATCAVKSGAPYSADIVGIDRFANVTEQDKTFRSSATSTAAAASSSSHVDPSPATATEGGASTADEGDRFMVVCVTLHALKLFQVNNDVLAEIASIATSMNSIYVAGLRGCSEVLVGDYSWATQIYRVEYNTEKENLKLVEVCSEFTPSLTTTCGTLTRNLYCRGDSDRNFFLFSLSVEVEKDSDGNVKLVNPLDLHQEDPVPEQNKKKTSHLECNFRLASRANCSVGLEVDSAYKCVKQRLTDCNPDFHPPFPVRRVRPNSCIMLPLNDGSVYLVSAISHDLLSILHRLETEILKYTTFLQMEQTGSNKLWEDPTVAQHCVVPRHLHRQVVGKHRRLTVSNSVADVNVIASWGGLVESAQDFIVETMKEEYPAVSRDGIDSLVDALRML